MSFPLLAFQLKNPPPPIDTNSGNPLKLEWAVRTMRCVFGLENILVPYMQVGKTPFTCQEEIQPNTRRTAIKFGIALLVK